MQEDALDFELVSSSPLENMELVELKRVARNLALK
jgi:hypothetical protein